jgi:hypothetical protein
MRLCCGFIGRLTWQQVATCKVTKARATNDKYFTTYGTYSIADNRDGPVQYLCGYLCMYRYRCTYVCTSVGITYCHPFVRSYVSSPASRPGKPATTYVLTQGRLAGRGCSPFLVASRCIHGMRARWLVPPPPSHLPSQHHDTQIFSIPDVAAASSNSCSCGFSSFAGSRNVSDLRSPLRRSVPNRHSASESETRLSHLTNSTASPAES